MNETTKNHSPASDPRKGGAPAPAGRLKRIAALAAVVFLAGLYLVTFFLAILGNERSMQLLRFCFGMTIFLPIFLWVVIWAVGIFRNKRSMASLDILNSNPGERAKMEEAVAREADRNRAPAEDTADSAGK